MFTAFRNEVGISYHIHNKISSNNAKANYEAAMYNKWSKSLLSIGMWG